MAYSTANRPYLIVPAIAGGFGATIVNGVAGSSDCGGNVWAYRSTNTVAEAMATGFFSDGFKMGLRKGDIMFLASYTTALAVSSGAIGIVTASVTSSAATVGVLFSSST